MISNFSIVFSPVCMLFLLMLLGLFMGRKQYMDDSSAAFLSRLVMNIVVPCTVINGFQIERSPETVRESLLCIAAAAIIVLGLFLISLLSVIPVKTDRKKIYVLSSTLTNCGFVGYPLDAALIGAQGVFYGTGYVVMMNVFTFSLGIAYLLRGKEKFSLRDMLAQPVIISAVVGYALFLLDLRLPEAIYNTVSQLASLCMSLPMFIVGYHLSKVDLPAAFGNIYNWVYSALRLVLMPIVCIAGMKLCGIGGNVFLASVIAASCPSGSIVTILAAKYGHDARAAAELNAMQTLLSVLTLSVILSAAIRLA